MDLSTCVDPAIYGGRVIFVVLERTQDSCGKKLAQMLKRFGVRHGVVGESSASDELVAIVITPLEQVWMLEVEEGDFRFDLPAWTRGMKCLVLNAEWMGNQPGLRKALRAFLVRLDVLATPPAYVKGWRRQTAMSLFL